jgi:tRNA(Ser,Leu) C12 N-acetylase TAN1
MSKEVIKEMEALKITPREGYLSREDEEINDAIDDCIEIFNRYLLKKLSKVEEYATFCIECDRRGLPLITFNDWLERVEHHKN